MSEATASTRRSSPAAAYMLAAALVSAATLLTWALWPWIAPNISPLFFAAVMVSAWYGGLGAGLLATGLAGAASVYMLMPDAHDRWPIDGGSVLRMAVFCAVAVLISWLNEQRRQAEAGLREANEALEARVRRRTGQLERAVRQLRELAAEVSQTEERGRVRVAAELHDEIGQPLALARMKLQAFRGDPAAMEEEADDVLALVDQSIQRVRSLMFQLSPPVLHQVGLAAAVRSLGEQIERRHELEVAVEGEDRPELTEELRVVLFQAVRELMVNVVKHARAKRVVVALGWEAGEARVRVEDDGKGFVPDERGAEGEGGFGLFHVRQRVEHLGGWMRIASGEGRGTSVELGVPAAPPAVGPGGTGATRR